MACIPPTATWTTPPKHIHAHINIVFPSVTCHFDGLLQMDFTPIVVEKDAVTNVEKYPQDKKRKKIEMNPLCDSRAL